MGELERNSYPAAGLAKFEALAGKGLTIAYQSPMVTIYRVAEGE